MTYAGSWFDKARANVDAIKLLRTLQRETRAVTPAEQSVLAKYARWSPSGWRRIYIRQLSDVGSPAWDPSSVASYRAPATWGDPALNG